MDCELAVVVLPVTDVDRAKRRGVACAEHMVRERAGEALPTIAGAHESYYAPLAEMDFAQARRGSRGDDAGWTSAEPHLRPRRRRGSRTVEVVDW